MPGGSVALAELSCLNAMGSHSLGVPWLQVPSYGHLCQKLSPCRRRLAPMPADAGTHLLRDGPVKVGAWCRVYGPAGGEPGSHPSTPAPGAAALGRSWRGGSCCSWGPPRNFVFLTSTQKLCVSDMGPGDRDKKGVWSCCIIARLTSWKEETYFSNTACVLRSGVLRKKEEKVKLRSSIPSLFSDHYHTQNRDLLLFICGFGVFLLKWPKLQCLFPEFSRVAWSGSTSRRMPLRGARRRSTYVVNYKWPQAEKQLPECLAQPRGRDLRAKAATEIKEATEVFCCNLKCLQFLRKVNRLGGLLWLGSHSQ